jgi:hypothetical protein
MRTRTMTTQSTWLRCLSSSSLALVLLAQSAHGRSPTYAPTGSMWPTTSMYPTSSPYPTNTWTPTITPFPSVAKKQELTAPNISRPSNSPSEKPSKALTAPISSRPSNSPSEKPSKAPFRMPSRFPTHSSSDFPSDSPSMGPISDPSLRPSEAKVPSKSPFLRPSTKPSKNPFPQPRDPSSNDPSLRPHNANVFAKTVTATPTSGLVGGGAVIVTTPAPTVTTTLTAAQITPAPSTSIPAPSTSGPMAVTSLSDQPSLVPSTRPLVPTVSPTGVGTTASPTPLGVSTSQLLDPVMIKFVYALPLSQNGGVFQWEILTKGWFEAFYTNATTAPTTQRGMQTTFSVRNQSMTVENGIPVNTIIYAQQLDYFALDGAGTPEFYATYPFSISDANAAYAAMLKANFPTTFGSVQTPLGTPSFVVLTNAPTATPTTGTPSLTPSAGPTGTLPTTLPSLIPSQTLSSAPSQTPSAVGITGTPSTSPAKPTTTAIDISLNDVSLAFVNAGDLSSSDIAAWESTMQDWFTGYFFTTQQTSGRRRRLQLSMSLVRDMTSTYTFVQQKVVKAGDGTSTNTVTYKQLLSYVALDGAATPDELAVLPFKDASYNAQLGVLLRSKFATFSNLRLPLEKWVIIGIAGGGAVLLAAICCCCLIASRRGSRRDYMQDGGPPPSQFNITADEDVSTMEDPIAGRMLSIEPSLSGYGDQRYVLS